MKPQLNTAAVTNTEIIAVANPYETQSKRGQMIEDVVRPFLTQNLFKKIEGFKEKLQGELNSKLEFKVTALDIKNENNFTVGQISFEDENNSSKVINFIITGKFTIE